MKKIFLVGLFFLSNAIFAQSTYSIDSSYTIKSTYTKLIKKYPFIEIVQEAEKKNIAQINDIVYSQNKNRELHLDAYFNKTKKRNPAIIMIHGGGWRSGNKNQMEVMAQEIATKGYSCFAIEYRLSLEAKYPEAIYDVKNAIKFIKDNAKKFNADKKKLLF